MAKQRKPAQHKNVRFEPDRVMIMVAIVSALTLLLCGALTAL